ncbi:hypothetical protein QRD89_06770 [Halobacillus sp. ACCC02827]|nr:hypothetical protein QRD89_06770 [Halobacillus sp. ACCC02827]
MNDIFSDVKRNIDRKNKLLFTRNSPSLQPLRDRMAIQPRRTLVMWALESARVPLLRLQDRYPEEERPRICLERCDEWAQGAVKMPEAKRAILDAHAASKEIADPAYAALCQAVGHAGATVHVGTHALGLPIYELTALVYEYGRMDFTSHARKRIKEYHHRLDYWIEHTDTCDREWAEFLR